MRSVINKLVPPFLCMMSDYVHVHVRKRNGIDKEVYVCDNDLQEVVVKWTQRKVGVAEKRN